MTTLPRSCLGCGTTIPAGSYCPTCRARQQRTRDARRSSRQQRGYDREHEAERRRWSPLVDAGQVACARCGQPIGPGTPWDLGHTDDRTAWTGPEHATCNRAAGGRNGKAITNWDRRSRW
jgi:hypothetical protein